MTQRRKALLITLIVMFLITALVFAAEHGHHEKPAPENGLHLSPELRNLLNQEMAAIQQGMMDLVPAIAAGDWDAAAGIGKKIKASYIMKQKLTAKQKEELHRLLPPGFIEMDQNFHNSAGMLAHAAEMKNADVVNFYFFKLNQACVACHGKFASKRFPALAEPAGGEEHHH
jgi:hypothetical protein